MPKITRICPVCNSSTSIHISNETAEGFKKYEDGTYQFIQDVDIPEYDTFRPKAIVREFYKSGFCLHCMKIIFGGDDESYEKVATHR